MCELYAFAAALSYGLLHQPAQMAAPRTTTKHTHMPCLKCLGKSRPCVPACLFLGACCSSDSVVLDAVVWRALGAGPAPAGLVALAPSGDHRPGHLHPIHGLRGHPGPQVAGRGSTLAATVRQGGRVQLQGLTPRRAVDAERAERSASGVPPEGEPAGVPARMAAGVHSMKVCLVAAKLAQRSAR